jgi:hypothetical protein
MVPATLSRVSIIIGSTPISPQCPQKQTDHCADVERIKQDVGELRRQMPQPRESSDFSPASLPPHDLLFDVSFFLLAL